jgi:hypothetical protein
MEPREDLGKTLKLPSKFYHGMDAFRWEIREVRWEIG